MMKLSMLVRFCFLLFLVVEPADAAHKRQHDRHGERQIPEMTAEESIDTRSLMAQDKKGEMKETNAMDHTIVEPTNQDQDQDQEQPNQAVSNHEGGVVNDVSTTANDEQVMETVGNAGPNVDDSSVGSSGLVDGSITPTQSRPSSVPKTKACCDCHTHKVPCLRSLWVSYRVTGPNYPNNYWKLVFNLKSGIQSFQFSAYDTPAYYYLADTPPPAAVVSGTWFWPLVPVYDGSPPLRSEKGFGRDTVEGPFSPWSERGSIVEAKGSFPKVTANINGPTSYVETDVVMSFTVKTESGSLFLRGSLHYANCYQNPLPNGYNYNYEFPEFLDTLGCCTYVAVIGGTGSFRLATGSVRVCGPLNDIYLDFSGVCGCEENTCCATSSSNN